MILYLLRTCVTSSSYLNLFKNSNKTPAHCKAMKKPISKYSRKYSTASPREEVPRSGGESVVKQESTFTTSSGLTLSIEFIE